MQIFSNFAQTYLTAEVSDSATSLSVPTSDGGLFTAPGVGEFELITLTDGTYWEVVKLTSRAGDVLTVERAYEGIARVWPHGTIVKNSVTKDTLDRFLQKEQIGASLAVYAYHHFR